MCIMVHPSFLEHKFLTHMGNAVLYLLKQYCPLPEGEGGVEILSHVQYTSEGCQ